MYYIPREGKRESWALYNFLAQPGSIYILINSPFTLALAATVEMPGEFVSATKQSIRRGKVIHFSVFTDNCFEMHNYFKAVEMKATVEMQRK